MVPTVKELARGEPRQADVVDEVAGATVPGTHGALGLIADVRKRLGVGAEAPSPAKTDPDAIADEINHKTSLGRGAPIKGK